MPTALSRLTLNAQSLLSNQPSHKLVRNGGGFDPKPMLGGSSDFLLIRFARQRQDICLIDKSIEWDLPLLEK